MATIDVKPRLVFLDSPPSHLPGRVQAIYEKVGGDGTCELKVTYENVSAYHEDRNNQFELLETEDEELAGITWGKCLCVAPTVISCSGNFDQRGMPKFLQSSYSKSDDDDFFDEAIREAFPIAGECFGVEGLDGWTVSTDDYCVCVGLYYNLGESGIGDEPGLYIDVKVYSPPGGTPCTGVLICHYNYVRISDLPDGDDTSMATAALMSGVVLTEIIFGSGPLPMNVVGVA